MKKSFWTLLLLLFTFCLTSCKKEINPSDIYGIWNVESESTTDGPRFVRLDFADEDCYYYVDPVVSDTLYVYKSIKVLGDSLLLTDRLSHTTLCIIDELRDSSLTLSNIDGVKKKVMYRKSAPFKKRKGKIDLTVSGHGNVLAKDFNKDSLDIIMRTNIFISRDYNECSKYHGCTREEMLEARTLLMNHIDSLKRDEAEKLKKHITDYRMFTEMNPFDHYFRQYYAYEENGDKIIEVNLQSSIRVRPGEGYTAMKRYWYNSKGGGPQTGAGATINLTKRTVSFSVNGIL